MATPRTFVSAVNQFVKDADWLTDADAPAIFALKAIAKELDGGKMQAALVAQYGLVYRSLLKRAPGADADASDPLEAALRAANDE